MFTQHPDVMQRPSFLHAALFVNIFYLAAILAILCSQFLG